MMLLVGQSFFGKYYLLYLLTYNPITPKKR